VFVVDLVRTLEYHTGAGLAEVPDHTEARLLLVDRNLGRKRPDQIIPYRNFGRT